MTANPLPNAAGDLPTAVRNLEAAAAAERCNSCGCRSGTLEHLAEHCTSGDAPPEFVGAAELARSRLREVRHDRLGRPVCHPAEVANALGIPGSTCTVAPVEERIGGAPGARPHLKNIAPESFERLRETARVHDRIGATDLGTVFELARQRARESPGPAQPWQGEVSIPVVPPHLPLRTIQDLSGCGVICADCARGLLSLEHFRNDGVIDAIVEGRAPEGISAPTLERGLVSRLDHAAYLGRGLARAAEALRTGLPHRHDAAPEATVCACDTKRRCFPEPQED